MIFPLKFALGLAILAFPIVEIALLIKAGAAFGFWPLLFWIIATAVLGSTVIQRSGLSIFSRVFAHIEAGGSGVEPMLDQFLAVTGGVLLILPGLLGDAVGALMLVPAVRWMMVRPLASLFTIQTDADTTRTRDGGAWQSRSDDPFARGPDSEAKYPSQDGGVRGRSGRRADPPIIEGEYHRLDDDPKQE